jgi:isoquinoline 1-oxidoreductase beta subunit
MASVAAKLPMPEKVNLKSTGNFKIIGTSKKNVDGRSIVTGKPMFGIDQQRDGMLIAMIVHPPAFGLKLKSLDQASVKGMPGIRDVFTINTLPDDFIRNAFDTATYTDLPVIVGNTTWEVLNAKKAVKVEWEPISNSTVTVDGWGGREVVTIPAGLESTVAHKAQMNEWSKKSAKVMRKDGDPEGAFKKAARVIERTYTAPFLAHNCMEPMNFFAHVTPEKAVLAGPIQAPEFIRKTVSARLGLPVEKIEIELLRMGGGFGRRAYGHYVLEAALISQHIKLPVKLMYTREDDMSYGIYRPAYTATYRAALDANNQLIAFHVKGGGIPESAVHPDRFPAGTIDNYLAEGWEIGSNITIGAFRAPGSNFIAGAEQSFLDELAQAMGKDPIAFRLELLERARTNPVGKNNDYDASRYAGVLKLVKEKSNWSQPTSGVHRGVAAYFCHNSYVAQVLDIVMRDNKPVIEKVVAAVDCGIVINKDAASNMGEGAIVDGIGNALYGEMTFRDGMPEKTNLDAYRIIRSREVPKSIEVHFVENDIDPTGLGEPLFPPIFAALANSLYRATGKRYYSQPFQPQIDGKNTLM